MHHPLNTPRENPLNVVPAKAGTQAVRIRFESSLHWAPAFAGTTHFYGIFLALFFLLSAPCVHAADWIKLELPNTEDQYFYDRSKLVVHGSEVTYWKKVQFKQAPMVKNRPAQSGLMRERIDCKEHTLRLLSFLYHDAQGAVIEYVAEAEKEGAPIIPETVGDWFEQALCALAAKDPDSWIKPWTDKNAL